MVSCMKVAIMMASVFAAGAVEHYKSLRAGAPPYGKFAIESRRLASSPEPVNCQKNTYYWGYFNKKVYCVWCPKGKYSQGCISCDPDPKSSACQAKHHKRVIASAPPNVGAPPAAPSLPIKNLCSKGKYANDDSGCADCPIGKWQSMPKQHMCYRCPPGMFQPRTGEYGCYSCPAGKFQSKNGASKCTSCPCSSGSKGAKTVNQCHCCPSGKYADHSNVKLCHSCRAGRFSSKAGEHRCWECPAGKFQDSSGSSKCQHCPRGQRTVEEGTSCQRGAKIHIHSGKDIPILTVLGANPLYLKAKHATSFKDPGARCIDKTDGDLSKDVDVDFDSMVLSKPGNYRMKYVCRDSAEDIAYAIRNIIVTLDSSTNSQGGPMIKVIGADPRYIKQEFTHGFTDEGAFCTDPVDGDISDKVDVDFNNVKLDLVGTYILKYECKDSRGLKAESTRKIVVTPSSQKPGGPVIKVLGPNPRHIKQEFTHGFTDEGATCQDAKDGDLDGKIDVDFNNVNLGKVGTYIITYFCTNSAGETSKSTRKLIVDPNQKAKPPSGPQVNIVGPDPYYTRQDSSKHFEFMDSADCTDPKYGNLNKMLLNSDYDVDMHVPGTYVVTYTCMNPVGQIAKATRKVIVTPKGHKHKGPVIKVLGPNPRYIKQEFTHGFTDEGATCQDAKDGDLDGNVDVDFNNVKLDIVGTYILKYECKDSAGLKSTANRKIIVLPSKAQAPGPVLNILGPNPRYIKQELKSGDRNVPGVGGHNEGFEDDGATCQDAQDGDLDGNVDVDFNNVKLDIIGTYVVHYKCTDSAGKTSRAARKIIVTPADGKAPGPVIKVLGPNPRYLEQEVKRGFRNTPGVGGHNEGFEDDGATCQDAQDGDLDGNVDVDFNNVKLDIVGTYIITYNCRDSAGLLAQASRKIIVTPTDKPMIKVLGPNPRYMSVDQQGGFVDDGASCRSRKQGDLSDTVQVDFSDVHLRQPGSYSMKYTCTSPTGEVAHASREVIVSGSSEREMPVITVNGDSPTYLSTSDDVYHDAGARCSDEQDGNLNQYLATDFGTVDLHRPVIRGTYYFKYHCRSPEGLNAITRSREIIVRKGLVRHPPTINIRGANPVHVRVQSRGHNMYRDAGATCDDSVDGDLTKEISVDFSQVDFDIPGTYELPYICENSIGQRSEDSRTLVVEGRSRGGERPRIILMGQDPMHITLGMKFTDPGVKCRTSSNNLDNNIQADFQFSEMNKPGTYQIKYRCEDKSDGLDAIPRYRVVVVSKPKTSMRCDPDAYVDKCGDLTRTPDHCMACVRRAGVHLRRKHIECSAGYQKRLCHYSQKLTILLKGPKNTYRTSSSQHRQYLDPGAICRNANGHIYPVTMDTSTVDLGAPGVYHVYFHCKHDGVKAPTVTRKVIVARGDKRFGHGQRDVDDDWQGGDGDGSGGGEVDDDGAAARNKKLVGMMDSKYGHKAAPPEKTPADDDDYMPPDSNKDDD